MAQPLAATNRKDSDRDQIRFIVRSDCGQISTVIQPKFNRITGAPLAAVNHEDSDRDSIEI